MLPPVLINNINVLLISLDRFMCYWVLLKVHYKLYIMYKIRVHNLKIQVFVCTQITKHNIVLLSAFHKIWNSCVISVKIEKYAAHKKSFILCIMIKKSEQKCVSVTYLLCIKIKEQFITPFSYIKYSS